jgi:O-antigen/teichoic acid export membrane protein
MKPFRFFKGLSWLIFLNIVIKPVWIFAIDRQVQNRVGFEAYGTYFALLNLSIVLSFIADAGLTNMINRQIAMNGAKAALPFRRLVFIKALLLLLYCAIVLLVARMSGLVHWHILFQVILIQVLTSIFLFCRNIITAHQLFTVDAWLSVIDKLLMIFICGVFIYIPLTFGTIDLTIFLNSQIVCTAIAIGVAVFILLYKRLLANDVQQSLPTGIFTATLPFALIILLMSAHYRLDGFLLERLYANGAYEAVIYASAFRLLDAGNMIGFLAASFLVPFIARNQNNHLLLQKTKLFLRHALLL